MPNAGFRKLKVWQEAHEFTLLIYQITKDFPKQELFCLTSQIRRAAVSIPANIVEGQARSSKKEFLQFLYIANGSLVEAEYYIELAMDLRYINRIQTSSLLSQQQIVGNLLNGLIKSLKLKINS